MSTTYVTHIDKIDGLLVGWLVCDKVQSNIIHPRWCSIGIRCKISSTFQYV